MCVVQAVETCLCGESSRFCSSHDITRSIASPFVAHIVVDICFSRDQTLVVCSHGNVISSTTEQKLPHISTGGGSPAPGSSMIQQHPWQLSWQLSCLSFFRPRRKILWERTTHRHSTSCPASRAVWGRSVPEWSWTRLRERQVQSTRYYKNKR